MRGNIQHCESAAPFGEILHASRLSLKISIARGDEILQDNQGKAVFLLFPPPLRIQKQAEFAHNLCDAQTVQFSF